jgi:hypothetical protein
MKKYLIIATFVCFWISADAQSWQGIVTHNGYQCHSLGSLVNHTVLAGLSTDEVGNKVLHVKVKTPFQLQGGTAWVKIDGSDIATALHYKNGWAYYDWYVYAPNGYGENLPKTFTFYKDNDDEKQSKTVTVNLHKLYIPNLAMNKKPFVTYW